MWVEPTRSETRAMISRPAVTAAQKAARAYVAEVVATPSSTSSVVPQFPNIVSAAP
jgi:hypothetical protein